MRTPEEQRAFVRAEAEDIMSTVLELTAGRPTASVIAALAYAAAFVTARNVAMHPQHADNFLSVFEDALSRGADAALPDSSNEGLAKRPTHEGTGSVN